MALPVYRLFIDGQAVDTSDHYELHYPFNGEIVGMVARAGEQETDAAIAGAARAYNETRRLARARRTEILNAMSRGVAERRSDFERAITLGTGKPIEYARAEVGRTVGVLALAAEEVKRFGRAPNRSTSRPQTRARSESSSGSPSVPFLRSRRSIFRSTWSRTRSPLRSQPATRW